ncbi:MAG TPA: hypothetical protein VHB50_20805 [Bryobacteraceae bacterium]|nr:hypothetical protein [Bryobacteraceae bacterium]
MRYRRWVVGLMGLWFAAVLLAGKKKNADDFTQTLELPKDPPAVGIGDVRRLVFQVSPLSGKGLLTQQTRDALRAILKENGGAPVVHIRAFVAGSGDMRRVPQIVSEVMTDKKMPIPSVSVIQAGGLPVENAQVVLEAVSAAKRDVNPGGIDFIPGEEVTASDPAAPTRPLLDKALTQLTSKADPASTIAVTCFVSTLSQPAELTAAISARYPGAAIDLVQTQRLPYQAFAACQAVTRGGKLTADKLAFTGTRVAFGAGEKDAALAFQRLDRDLSEAGASPSSILLTNVYPLSGAVAKLVRNLRPPAAPMTIVPFEGVASVEGGFAVDAVASVINK